WASGIELGLRAVSIAIVLSLCGTEHLEAAFRRKLWATLAAHLSWLRRYPSLHSSANNHLIAETVGIFLLAVLAPALPDAASAANEAEARLVAEGAKQILPDGV